MILIRSCEIEKPQCLTFCLAVANLTGADSRVREVYGVGLRQPESRDLGFEFR